MKRLFVLAVSLAVVSCGIPKDPNLSWEKAIHDGLKVGLTHNPPFVVSSQTGYSGTEIELIREFANLNGLQVIFKEGSESELIKDLEQYQLHIILGGFDDRTLWKSKAGLTIPYDKKHVALIPRGENRLAFKLEKFFFEHKQDGKI